MNDNANSNVTGADDLAKAALQQAQSTPIIGGDEVAASDQVAETLSALQNVIERNANELQKLEKELKERRDSLRNIFENDSELATAEDQAKQYTNQVKERKSKLQGDAQVTQLKVQIGELTEQKKELEEGLSNHLVNYYQMTNSTSFDTSDGDQWEFAIKARVKPHKGSPTQE